MIPQICSVTLNFRLLTSFRYFIFGNDWPLDTRFELLETQFLPAANVAFSYCHLKSTMRTDRFLTTNHANPLFQQILFNRTTSECQIDPFPLNARPMVTLTERHHQMNLTILNDKQYLFFIDHRSINNLSLCDWPTIFLCSIRENEMLKFLPSSNMQCAFHDLCRTEIGWHVAPRNSFGSIKPGCPMIFRFMLHKGNNLIVLWSAKLNTNCIHRLFNVKFNMHQQNYSVELDVRLSEMASAIGGGAQYRDCLTVANSSLLVFVDHLNLIEIDSGWRRSVGHNQSTIAAQDTQLPTLHNLAAREITISRSDYQTACTSVPGLNSLMPYDKPKPK